MELRLAQWFQRYTLTRSMDHIRSAAHRGKLKSIRTILDGSDSCLRFERDRWEQMVQMRLTICRTTRAAVVTSTGALIHALTLGPNSVRARYSKWDR